MILFIDTSGFHELRFALVSETGAGTAKVKEKIFASDYNKTTKTLSFFAKFFGKTNWKEISKIIVVSGPGSFSGIRVGVSMSLAFSLARGIPAFAVTKNAVPQDLTALLKLKKGLKKISGGFDLEYGAEPNITMPSSR